MKLKEIHEKSEKSSTYRLTETNGKELEETSRRVRQRIVHEWKMWLLHEAMVKMLKQLDECGSTIFEVSRRAGEKWMCFAVFALCCCNIPERRDK